MNAPCEFTSAYGSGAPALSATAPGKPPAFVSPGSGRNRSIPSTCKISPESGSPDFAPTTSESSIVGLAYCTPGTSCTRKIVRSSKPRPTPRTCRLTLLEMMLTEEANDETAVALARSIASAIATPSATARIVTPVRSLLPRRCPRTSARKSAIIRRYDRLACGSCDRKWPRLPNYGWP